MTSKQFDDACVDIEAWQSGANPILLFHVLVILITFIPSQFMPVLGVRNLNQLS